MHVMDVWCVEVWTTCTNSAEDTIEGKRYQRKTLDNVGGARGSAGVAGAPPRAKKNVFLGIFVGMRQNGAEFCEVHPRRRDKKVVGGSI